MVWSEETFKLVRDGIDAAKKCRTVNLSSDWKKNLEDRAKQINIDNNFETSLNIVIFHVKVPHHATKISTPDIKGGDQSKIDYEGLLHFNIKTALWAEPNARVIVLTDNEFIPTFEETERVKIVRLNLNSVEPMFERVVSMASYVQSSCFSAPTIFLDIDAFLIRPICDLFKSNFDIGLTHRHIVGQMSINEGVIFANTRNRDSVTKFFNSYLASYLAAEESQEIKSIYQNIRRWRGGQLAVNAAAGGFQVYSTSVDVTEYGTKIAYLPCSKYNLSQIDEREVTKNLRQRCCVLHLKGNRKGWIRKLDLSLKAVGFH
jgi:hypothetical protein